MKIRVDYTVEVDPAVIKNLISEYNTGETVSQFVRSYLASTTTLLDETIQNAIGETHDTEIVKANF